MPALSAFVFQQTIYRGSAVGKKVVQLALYEEGVGNIAQPAEGDAVMNDIRHQYTLAVGLEMVLVVPEAVGAKALLIDEHPAIIYPGYLRHPVHRDAQYGFEAIFDDLAGINPPLMWFTDNGEAHPGRSNVLEVGRVAEELPGQTRTYR